MNTPLFKQIKAVQTARKALEQRTMLGDPFPESEEYYKELDAALNDAGSTLAALNLNPDREKRIKELEEAGSKLIEAMNQHYFFMDGYKNGSASISEVKAASKDEHEAYCNLFNVIKGNKSDADIKFDAAASGFASADELTKVK